MFVEDGVDEVTWSPVSGFPRVEVVASGLAAGEDTPFFGIVVEVSFLRGREASEKINKYKVSVSVQENVNVKKN